MYYIWGKHKNRAQNDILLQFMEKYPDIAKGFTRRDKQLVDSLWQQLAESLNSAGPPTKDITGWKKVWTDWKSEIKKKLAQNKAEERATGGGPFSKNTLNQTEESIVRICGMVQRVEGVSGSALGLEEEYLISSDDDMPSTSAKRPRLQCPQVQNPKAKETTRRPKQNGRYVKIQQEGNESNELLINSVNNLTQEFMTFNAKIIELLEKREEEIHDPLVDSE
ncbi:uncharacterized protein LOC118749973 [Rhagoletis pomonella]|uniref:uncharacterized protein LOC118749973 n=1 Tax=Rhagoletis pomonella TaxID=28610 RepID=UPI00177AD0FC|nr:uncharacterized protein LOC118749973 [Rhagoletis pomonella]